MKKSNKKDLKIDNEKTTKGGEVIPTNFMWMSLEEQKKKAQELSNISDKNKN